MVRGRNTLYQKLMNSPMPQSNGLFNQFPGQKAGLTPEQNQQFNRDDAWKLHGYTIQLATNTVTKTPINISGDGWMMFGISFKCIQAATNDATMPTSIDLLINQELVLEEVPWALLDVKYMTNMFFPFVRMLSGSDNISLNILNGSTQNTVGVAFWYK